MFSLSNAQQTRLQRFVFAFDSNLAPVVGQQECRLYLFIATDPTDEYLSERVVYVGESARMPFDRLMEHIAGKPWKDTIVSWRVDPRVFSSKEEVWAAERDLIAELRPLYNDEYNRGNPERIPYEVQVAQRHARDR